MTHLFEFVPNFSKDYIYNFQLPFTKLKLRFVRIGLICDKQVSARKFYKNLN